LICSSSDSLSFATHRKVAFSFLNLLRHVSLLSCYTQHQYVACTVHLNLRHIWCQVISAAIRATRHMSPSVAVLIGIIKRLPHRHEYHSPVSPAQPDVHPIRQLLRPVCSPTAAFFNVTPRAPLNRPEATIQGDSPESSQKTLLGGSDNR